MHIADGVLSLPVVGAAAAVAGGGILYAVKKTKAEEVPLISLLSGAFFVFALISIPIGPTTVHPLLAGLLGIILGMQAFIAVIIGLVLHVLLFQHGGLTTLGVNLILVVIPALMAGKLFYSMKRLPVFARAALAGGLAVVSCVLLLIILLLLSDPVYGEGTFSTINILAIAYMPLAAVEALLTGFAVNFLYKTRPELLQKDRMKELSENGG